MSNSKYSEWQASRILPSFEHRSVKKISSILAERNNPRPKKKVVVPNIILNPKDLDPIHLRSEPLPLLSPTIELFCRTHGARNIVKRRQSDQDNYKPIFRQQRPAHPFVDNSAIESDGEGGDVASLATTPESSRPSTPIRTPTPSIRLQVQPSIVKRVKVKKPKEHCQTCNRYFDGSKQLDIHLKSKKHWKAVRNSQSSHCVTCNRLFTSYHNLRAHKCENFIKHPRF